jgi:spore coat polysaccharide biosynthesis protein SpsF (cytidylyltransferase family)
MLKKFGIIIQARTQSSRLPDKIILPFFKNETILDIIIRRFIAAFKNTPIIVATSSNQKDDIIEKMVSKYPDTTVFRGDEENVLKRFIEAALLNDLDSVLRVCSDNVFIDTDLAKTLIEIGKTKNLDYVSFKIKGDLPVMQSHQGFYTEFVSLFALKRIQSLTTEKRFIEHVTNYLYTHPDLFRIQLIPAPDLLYSLEELRLTIDTKADFLNAQMIYSKLIEANEAITLQNVIGLVMANNQLINSMREQIKLNSK